MHSCLSTVVLIYYMQQKKSAPENLPMWVSSYFDLCRQNFVNQIDQMTNMHKNCVDQNK